MPMRDKKPVTFNLRRRDVWIEISPFLLLPGKCFSGIPCAAIHNPARTSGAAVDSRQGRRLRS